MASVRIRGVGSERVELSTRNVRRLEVPWDATEGPGARIHVDGEALSLVAPDGAEEGGGRRRGENARSRKLE